MSKENDIDELLLEIAKKHFFLDTLETRNSDSMDFHDVPVWSIKSAIEEAYQAGLKHSLGLQSKPTSSEPIFKWGQIANAALKKHYGEEVKEYAKKRGHYRKDVLTAAHASLDRVFEQAWPSKGPSDNMKEIDFLRMARENNTPADVVMMAIDEWMSGNKEYAVEMISDSRKPSP